MPLKENDTEQVLIEQLVEAGYTYFYGPDIAPFSENPQRDSWQSVVLEKEFLVSLKRLNPDLPESAVMEAYRQVLNLGIGDVMGNNEKMHTFLCDGVTVEYFKDGATKGVNVRLLDVENIKNNSFWVVNQLVVKDESEKRLDVVVYVNGLPLVLVELKSALDENAGLDKAFTQLQNYKQAVPQVFWYNSLCILSDGIYARVASLSAPFSRFLPWKPPRDEQGLAKGVTEMEVMSRWMLKPEVLVKLIRFNTVFEVEEKKDQKTGTLSLVKIKKVAAYHQFYAVQKAVEQTLRATGASGEVARLGGEKGENFDEFLDTEEEFGKIGDRKIGLVWHTQGSGKSLSMVFYTGQIVVEPAMKNPTVVILTDRNDLDDQLFSTFANCKGLLRQSPVQAGSREELKELLKVSGGGVVFTTIQKFMPSEGNVYETLSDRSNIVVVADEAHRSQYGFKAREVEVEDGSEIRYGNAKYLRDALPNASFIGFTGTPVNLKDRSTRKVFGNEIDVYDIQQAVTDGATVPIEYESRLVKIKVNQEKLENIDYAIDEIDGASEEQKERAKKRNAQINAIVGHPDRLRDIASDIVYHFETRQNVFEGKAMIVCMTRDIAVRLYDEIVKLRPHWHDKDLDKGEIKVVMTSSSMDPEHFQPHHTTKDERKRLAVRLKDTKDNLKIVIVQSMWLTGFDVPCLHTMYVDKKMQGANLMQAIARVNRVYKDKPGGLIVDYIGIGQDLRNAMQFYVESGGRGDAVVDMRENIAGLKTSFEIVDQMFYGFDYRGYFKAEAREKLRIILGATDFILKSEDLKNRFLSEVTRLNKLFALSMPSVEAEKIREELAFFQGIKSRINKITVVGSKSDVEVETAIKQIVDDALSTGGIINVFEAAGVALPSVGILSDEFLQEVKNMQTKNIGFELLRKLLTEEVRSRKTKNIVQGKKFSEMLQGAITKYHNNQIGTAEVLEELTKIAKGMRFEDGKAKDLGLTSEEYAFYTVLAENESTKFLEDSKMKELINVIVNTVRNNATIDWEKRKDVKAKLRLTVKKILMRYGYPPDLARLEADRVLEQSEKLASSFLR